MSMTRFETPNTQSERVRPDSIITDSPPDDEFPACTNPSCGARPHDAPEGVNIKGEPHFNFGYCWKCGNRPGTNVHADLAKMRSDWEAFQAFRAKETPSEGRGLTPPADQSEIERLKEQLRLALGQTQDQTVPAERSDGNG